MKMFILSLIAVSLNLSAMADGTSLITADAARIRAIAVKAILNKYENLSVNNLTFSGIDYSILPNNAEGLITVFYQVNITKNNIVSTTNGMDITTQAKSINVALSNMGDVMNVSYGVIITSQQK